MLSVAQISARVESLRSRSVERDKRQLDVLAVRKGNISQIYPQFFPEGIDANVVANLLILLPVTYQKLWHRFQQ